MHPRSLTRGSAAFWLLLSNLASTVWSEPDVYCKTFGDGSNNDFCVGLSTWLDPAFDNQDFLFTFNRTQSYSAGWTTVGVGNQMNRAIMFSLYGDPQSHSRPTLSVRSTVGHSPPVELSIADQYQQRIYIGQIESSWETSSVDGSTYASASLVCYGCNAWWDAPVSAATPVLPMIWAINTDQDLSDSEYVVDAALSMHDRFGIFDLDMTKETSIAPKPLPPTLVDFLKPFPPPAEIVPGGSGEFRDDLSVVPVQDGGSGVYSKNLAGLVSIKRKLWLVHGVPMAAAFFVLLPLGAFFVRSGSSHSLYLHLASQVLGSIIAVASMSLGFFLSHSIGTWHQYIGIALGFAILMQTVLGWQHHRVFLRLRRKTWWGTMHTWHGRLILLGGWINLLFGLRLADYTLRLQIAFATVAGLEVCALAFVTYKHSTGRPLGQNIKVPFLSKERVRWVWERQENESADSGEAYFALTGDAEVDEEDGNIDDGGSQEVKRKKSADYRRQSVKPVEMSQT